MTIGTRIQKRRDTAAAWTSANPVLALGEAGFETDTGKEKVGDGSTAWAALGYTYALATALTGEISARTSAVSGEAVVRAAADAVLTTNVATNASAITSEATARAAAVAAEAAIRAAADNTLTTNVAANASAIAEVSTEKVPISQSQAGPEGTVLPILSVSPFTAGNEPFQIQMNSFANTGLGAGTYNHGLWFGWNAARFSGGVSTPSKNALYMGFEDNYYDDGGDATYGPEWYVGYVSPDGTTVPAARLRPFYFRIKAGNTNSAITNVLINMDIGSGTTGGWSVWNGIATNTQLLAIQPTLMTSFIQTDFLKLVRIAPTSGVAQLTILAPGVGVNGHLGSILFQDAATQVWQHLATTGSYNIIDVVNSGRAQISLTSGATSQAAVTALLSKLVTGGDISTSPTTGAAQININAPGVGVNGHLAVLNFNDGATQSYSLLAQIGSFQIRDQANAGRAQVNLTPGSTSDIAITELQSVLKLSNSTSSSANAGGASALPATPQGYFQIQDSGGTTRKVPYYV